MAPDNSILMEKACIGRQPVGLYDLPGDIEVGPLFTPQSEGYHCFFQAYDRWMDGGYLELTLSDYGCGGCGHWMFGLETRPLDDFVKFLADQEGLKASRELMLQWLEHGRPYVPRYGRIVIGPLLGDLHEYLKTVTFFVDPDRLSILTLGANYYAAPGGVPPVIAPFGSGCMEFLALFDDLEVPQAIIGSTDMAMRRHLPPEIMAFTVTRPMYEDLCRLDEKSFLYKPFLQALKKARGW